MHSNDLRVYLGNDRSIVIILLRERESEDSVNGIFYLFERILYICVNKIKNHMC